MNANDAKALKQWDTIWVKIGTMNREDLVMATEIDANGDILVETRLSGWVSPERVARRAGETAPKEDTWVDIPDAPTSSGPGTAT